MILNMLTSENLKTDKKIRNMRSELPQEPESLTWIFGGNNSQSSSIGFIKMIPHHYYWAIKENQK